MRQSAWIDCRRRRTAGYWRTAARVRRRRVRGRMRFCSPRSMRGR